MTALCTCKHALMGHHHGKSTTQRIPCHQRDEYGRCPCQDFREATPVAVKGVRRGNLVAVATCRDRQYEVGTVLTSSHWRAPRRITQIREREIRMQNTSDYRSDFVRSLPPDVQALLDWQREQNEVKRG